MCHTLQLGDAQGDENKLADLCRHYGVRELSLFGSAVRGGDNGPAAMSTNARLPRGDLFPVMVELTPTHVLGRSSSSL
jgi:hypothetical protein